MVGKARDRGYAEMNGEIRLEQESRKICEAQFWVSEKRIYIRLLIVFENYQSKGYGTLLIDIFKGLATNLKKTLIVESLPNSEGFYEKLGFKRIKLSKSKKIELITMLWCPE